MDLKGLSFDRVGISTNEERAKYPNLNSLKSLIIFDKCKIKNPTEIKTLRKYPIVGIVF